MTRIEEPGDPEAARRFGGFGTHAACSNKENSPGQVRG